MIPIINNLSVSGNFLRKTIIMKNRQFDQIGIEFGITNHTNGTKILSTKIRMKDKIIGVLFLHFPVL